MPLGSWDDQWAGIYVLRLSNDVISRWTGIKELGTEIFDKNNRQRSDLGHAVPGKFSKHRKIRSRDGGYAAENYYGGCGFVLGIEAADF